MYVFIYTHTSVEINSVGINYNINSTSGALEILWCLLPLLYKLVTNFG